MTSQYKCPLCGASNCKNVYTLEDFLITHENYAQVECNNCGLRWTANPPSESEIGNYYKSEDYISHSDTKKGLTNRLYHLARRYMLGRKYHILRKYSGSSMGKLLDIGCGTGYFPAFAMGKGWQADATEPDERAAQYARSNFGLTVHQPANIKKLIKASYNAVTLWHVLEHLYNPEETLQTIGSLLKENGICIVALPNSESLDAGIYRQSWAAWDVPRHLWHFNVKSFTYLAEKSGFRVSKTIRMPLDAFYISILSEKNRNSTLQILRGLLAGMIVFVVSLFRKKKSSSLIYILEKKP